MASRSVFAANAAANAMAALLDGGSLDIHGGPAAPSADASAAGELLCSLRFADPAFLPADRGTAIANPLEPGKAVARGRAAWFRARTAAGDAVYDGIVGADAVLNVSEIVPGGVVTAILLTIAEAR